jgi:ribosomal-protein-serine acetyltransferase
MTLTVSESILLELIDDHHAQPLLDLLNKNREHLKEWLPWVDSMRSVDDFHRYITMSKKKQDDKMELGFVILYNGIVAGRIGLHYFDHHNKICAVGYWLGMEFVGKGIITVACKRLCEYAFAELGFNRIEIKCGVGNDKSAAVPKRLGFTKEGVLKQAEWVNGKFIDLNLYSLLKEDSAAKK